MITSIEVREGLLVQNAHYFSLSYNYNIISSWYHR
jgi:hypothetical protein